VAVRPRVLLIWNPVSTGVDASSVGAASVTAAAHFELVTRHTLAEGDAGRLAAEAADEGYDAVFVLGGDGTANEVVNGVGNRIPIGVLPRLVCVAPTPVQVDGELLGEPPEIELGLERRGAGFLVGGQEKP
jgi:diacylglycerol kinase family enzyme